MSFYEVLLTVFAVLLLIPSLITLAQVFFAYLPKKYEEIIPMAENRSVAVLIPAHNESSGVSATLDSVKTQLNSTDRLLVVADNCTDNTAEIAAENGAEVITRQDARNRGKGFALDFGIRHLSLNPPDVLVIVDADCILEPDAIKLLTAHALYKGRPVQALYMMYAKTLTFKSAISEFAWRVKNLVRPLGYANLGLPCQLMGTGMAFPWNTIVRVNLANGNIVEDMKLGIDLAMAEASPVFCPSAKVKSYFPIATEAQLGQRERWEHGHLATIVSETPKLIIQGVIKRDVNLLAMAFDLSVPPLALLVMLLLGFIAATGITLLLYDVGYMALHIAIAGVTLLSVAIGLAWLGWGRDIISFSTILLLPVYVIAKIPHYLKFLFKRQKSWNKTERD
jgi:cellulose synthase/poly-beta-1,6-N-acetylglucosamine synthase-like glycosyltransferase